MTNLAFQKCIPCRGRDPSLTDPERVTIQWWTHVEKGLHKNDFIMAAKTDELAS